MEEIKPLTVRLLEDIDKHSKISAISDRMDQVPRQTLRPNWPQFAYHPFARFSVAHSNDAVFLKYYVQEKKIRAVCNEPQSPVYTDSCVEFFLAPEKGKGYYNFEFNCIGTNLSAFGETRNERARLDGALLKNIRYQSTIHNDTDDGTIYWEFTVVIPVETFSMHTIAGLGGLKSSANFYKCGDALPEPHYLSWMPITSARPDFHLPEFFGPLHFE